MLIEAPSQWLIIIIAPATRSLCDDIDDPGGGQRFPVLHAWYLMDNKGKKLRLPRTMTFLGREDCDILVQCDAVDKRHAVITFDFHFSRFKVKDLSTRNGTYVNENRIPEQEYVALCHMDSLRFGHDCSVYHVERGEVCEDSPPPPLPHQPPPTLLALSSAQDEAVLEEVLEGSADETDVYFGYGENGHTASSPDCIMEHVIEHATSIQHNYTNPNCIHDLSKLGKFPSLSGNCNTTDSDDLLPVQLSNQGKTSNTSEQNLDESPLLGKAVEANHYSSGSSLRNQYPHSTDDVASISDVYDETHMQPRTVDDGADRFICEDDSDCKTGHVTESFSGSCHSGGVQTTFHGTKRRLSPGEENSHGQNMLHNFNKHSNVSLADIAEDPLCVTSRSDKRNSFKDFDNESSPVMELLHKVGPDGTESPVESATSGCQSDLKCFSSRDTVGALSFTVNISDGKKPLLRSGDHLSQFVPPKIRDILGLSTRCDMPPFFSRNRTSAARSCKNMVRQIGMDEQTDVLKIETPNSLLTFSEKYPPVSSHDATPAMCCADVATVHCVRETLDDISLNSRLPSKAMVDSKCSSFASAAFVTEAVNSAANSGKYSNATSFLIGRMFAGSTMGTECSDSNVSKRNRIRSAVSTEHAMYKEAEMFDRVSRFGDSVMYHSCIDDGIDWRDSLSICDAASINEELHEMCSDVDADPVTNIGRNDSRNGLRKPHGITLDNCPAPGSQNNDEESDLLCSIPSTTGDVIGGDEDVLSEAGTYTVEIELQDGEDEEVEARRQIDDVFGVAGKHSCFRVQQPYVSGFENCNGVTYGDTVKTLQDDEGKQCLTPCESALHLAFDAGNGVSHVDESRMITECSKGDSIPCWVSQLHSLTAANSSPSLSSSTNDTWQNSDVQRSKVLQNGVVGKRQGRGRKLPSLPSTDSEQFVVGKEHTATDSIIHRLHTPFSINQLDTDKPSSPNTVDCCDKYTPEASLSFKNGSDYHAADTTSPGHSSRCSLDTDFLLSDTHAVMVAMENRMLSQRSGDLAHSILNDWESSDVDCCSTVAIVNGNNFYKDQKNCSTNSTNCARKSVKCSFDFSPNRSVTSKCVDKKPLMRSLSELKHQSSVGRRMLCSGFSLCDAVKCQKNASKSAQSDHSDACSDYSDSSCPPTGPYGRSPVLGARQNRAFVLRRALSKASHSTESSMRTCSERKSVSTLRSSSIGGTMRKSDSGHCESDSRRSGITRRRSDISLGVRIAAKASENAGATAVRENRATKTNTGIVGTGRNSNCAVHTLSTRKASTGSSAKTQPSAVLRENNSSESPQHTGGLSIRGVIARAQVSAQSWGRADSPKNAEKLAWRRRKEYDPRRAVADAKAKSTDAKPARCHVGVGTRERMLCSVPCSTAINLVGIDCGGHVAIPSSSHQADSTSSSVTVAESEDAFHPAFLPFNTTATNKGHFVDITNGSLPVTYQSSKDKLSIDRLSSCQSFPKSAFMSPLFKDVALCEEPCEVKSSRLLDRHSEGTLLCDDVSVSTGVSTGVNSSQRLSGVNACRFQGSSAQLYDALMVSSIFHLSQKLRKGTTRTLQRLRGQGRVSFTPSPVDRRLSESDDGQIPAWKSANQELAAVLLNLRRLEHHLHRVDNVLFPEDKSDTEISGTSSSHRPNHILEIKRIYREMAGFQPIDQPPVSGREEESPEISDISRNMH